MRKDDFLNMMKQDLVTKNDKCLNDLLLCFEEVLKPFSSDLEISSEKTIEDCYKKMKDFARKNNVRGVYSFSPNEIRKFILNYFGIKEMEKSSYEFVKLEDFI